MFLLFYIFYNLLFPLVFLLYLPFYLVHIIRRGGLTKEYWQRFGFWGADVKAELAGKKRKVWIHAVSVGESVAAISFIKAWQARHPEDWIVFSCSTATAFSTIRRKNLAGVTVRYCPVDFGWAVHHALSVVSPHTLVIFEVEIWPNLIRQAAGRGIRVCLVNGRLSDKSSRGYARWRGIFRPIFDSFSVLCMQTPEDACRVRRIMGDSPKIKICDTMKFDQVPDVGAGDVSKVLDDVFGAGERLVLVAGSTHPGEEELICNAVRDLKPEYPRLKLVLVPRHCERAAEVENVLKAAGLTWKRLKDGDADGGERDALLVNTTGELMNYYGAADVAYVGKSMAGQTGGHNIIEPAIFGKAIIHGSHMENFRAVSAIFQEEKAALLVEKDEDFTSALKGLLADSARRSEMGARARGTVEKYRGAIARTLDAIDGCR